MTPKQLLEEADALRESLIASRRYLHTHAETGFDLTDTLAYVKKELADMGYEPALCGKSGLVALAGGKKKGPVFLIRGDMDALPIREQAEIDFPSTNGCMHACGHDLHTAMVLGAARLLKQHEDEIQGTVKLMFQPAEEIFEGARDMIRAGLLKNPDVDAALMIHVIAGMPYTPGTIIVSAPGISAPAADYFTITVHGKGCHGSMPGTGIDPLNAAAHILIALQGIHARELAVEDRAVLTIGTMNAGTAPNVIPDTVTMEGSLRTFDEQTRAFIKERMVQISEGTAASFRATATVSFGSGCPALENDRQLCLCAESYLRELLGKEKALSATQYPMKASGSEDFAYVSQKVPSVMLAMAAGQQEKGYCYPQHHPMVTFDEEILTGGSAAYAYVAMQWLAGHSRVTGE